MHRSFYICHNTKTSRAVGNVPTALLITDTLKLSVFEVCEEVVALVVHDDERREVLNIYLAYGFHTQFREIDNLYALDALLGEDCCRTAYRTQIETAMLAACVGNFLRTVTLGNHNHRTALALEEVYVRVHTACRSRTEAARRHAFRSLGRTCIVNRMLEHVFRHRLALVEHLFDACVGNVAGNDERTLYIKTSLDGILRQCLENLVHTLVEVYLDSRLHDGSIGRKETCRIVFQFLDKDTVFGNLGLYVTVCRAADTYADRARSCMAGHTDDLNVMNQILAAELCADTALLTYLENLGLPFEVTECTAAFVAACGKGIVVTCRGLLHCREVGFCRRAAYYSRGP